MASLIELASIEEIQEEYKKSLLLNMFRKTVVRMNNNDAYKARVHKLFKESTNKKQTVIAIIKKQFDFDLSQEDATLMLTWFTANLNKLPRRKTLSLELKHQLYKQQNGKCLVCGEDLGNDMSKIHIDHIIPWTLVGDELQNNYQDLCQTCNECKSAHTDYIFKHLINLN